MHKYPEIQPLNPVRVKYLFICVFACIYLRNMNCGHCTQLHWATGSTQTLVWGLQPIVKDYFNKSRIFFRFTGICYLSDVMLFV